MSDIFTRVFLTFWLTIVLIAAGAAAVVAIDFTANPDKPTAVTQEAQRVLLGSGVEGLKAWLRERNASNRQQRTLIINADGEELLGQRPPTRFGPGPDGPGPKPAPLEGDGPMEREPFGDPGGVRGPPGSAIHASDGTIYRVLFDPPPRKGALSPPFSWPVRSGLVALAVIISGLLSYLFARSISAPVERLQRAAHALSAGNLNARAGPTVTDREDEIGLLGREFDSMADRLGSLIAARQRLLQDVSHELRSPLARLQMALDLAHQDPATTPNQLERIAREAGRLERLIAGMLEYARLDRDPAARELQPVDLADLLRQVVEDARFASGDRAKHIHLHVLGNAVLSGDVDALHAAIENVVRNALQHAGDESSVEVTLGADDREARITVRDYGPGVRDSELERIFEPFYRAGVVDSKHISSDGTGIGLAITARAVALHGGRVTATNAEGGGLNVSIVLPK